MKTIIRETTEPIRLDQDLYWRDLAQLRPAPPVAELADRVAGRPTKKRASSLRDLLARFWAWLLQPGEPAQLTVRVPDGWYPPVL